MPNVSALPDTASISEAWRNAARYLHSIKGERGCYNLIYAITAPHEATTDDRLLYGLYDQFAREAQIGTTTTVANTIFPVDTYAAYRAPAFYDHYEEKIYPQVKKAWGTYFERMIRRRRSDGEVMLEGTGAPVNPLAKLVAKLAARTKSGHGSKNHYELPIADEAFELTTNLPEHDCGHHRGGPCLSHLSFKLDDQGTLRLTAFYRSHFYVERALGNLLGLARLQAFVATEVGVAVGPLTCIASYAWLESSLKHANAQKVKAFLQTAGVI